jgi:hypothetical protein
MNRCIRQVIENGDLKLLVVSFSKRLLNKTIFKEIPIWHCCPPRLVPFSRYLFVKINVPVEAYDDSRMQDLMVSLPLMSWAQRLYGLWLPQNGRTSLRARAPLKFSNHYELEFLLLSEVKIRVLQLQVVVICHMEVLRWARSQDPPVDMAQLFLWSCDARVVHELSSTNTAADVIYFYLFYKSMSFWVLSLIMGGRIYLVTCFLSVNSVDPMPFTLRHLMLARSRFPCSPVSGRYGLRSRNNNEVVGRREIEREIDLAYTTRITKLS